MKFPVFYFVLFMLYSSSVFSQAMKATKAEEEADDPYENKSYFMTGLNYMSNNVYLGRKDSVALPFISPYIGYHFSNGIYGKAIVSDAPTKGYIDLLTLEAGWDHNLGDHFNLGVCGDKFYYNKNSTNIRSATKGGLGANGQYTNDWIEPQLTWDFNFNKASTDYVLGLELDHDFDLKKHKFHIVPAVSLNYGTRHFYDDYFINRFLKKDKTLAAYNVVADANEFVPLDYEIKTKFTYRVTKWLFTLTPTYSVPTSPATITLPGKNKNKTTETEKLSNSFFVELDICHR